MACNVYGECGADECSCWKFLRRGCRRGRVNVDNGRRSEKEEYKGDVWAWRPILRYDVVFEYDADSDGRPRFGSMSTFLKGGFYVSPTTSATTDGMSGTELSGSFLGRLAEERRKNYRKEIKKHL